jgi:glycine/D-amino acid oxidase-like deaminating enzyme
MSRDTFKNADNHPFWRTDMDLPNIPHAVLDAREDVVVVGSGYTGLHTALHLARGRRNVVIVEAGQVGEGCSTRNGGQVSSEMHPPLDGLIAEYGHDRAIQILSTGVAAHKYLRKFVQKESISCSYQVCGHFIGAHRKDRMAALQTFANTQHALGVTAETVSRESVHTFVASDDFYGGLHLPDWASLHPGRLLSGLVARVIEAGVRIIPNTRVSRIVDCGKHIEMLAGAQKITADQVILGTDGYTDGASKWMRRRIVSLNSVIVATEKIDRETIDTLYPRASMVYDTRLNVTYHRPTPKGDRVILGTVVPVDVNNLPGVFPQIRANMLRTLPQLEGVSIDHVWSGQVGATFSHLPHVGLHGRIGYAIGYNGTGVAMTAYLGRALARKILCQLDSATGVDGLELETRPFFHGQTWYRRPILALHGLKDRLPRHLGKTG